MEAIYESQESHTSKTRRVLLISHISGVEDMTLQ